MKHIYLVAFLFLILSAGVAQNFTDSNLPIVVINTDINQNTGQPYPIQDEIRVFGNMKIIYHTDGSRNYLTDQNNPQFLEYDGRMNIEIRGSSSAYLPKKPYGLTTLEEDDITNNNVSIFDMPEENDWVLNSLAFDPALIRDYFSYTLAARMGNYAPRGKFCEVVVNGEYLGLYVFMEKIKTDDGRVDIEELLPDENILPELSGGYITKADKTTGNDPVAWYMTGYNGESVAFIHHDPKPTDITSWQDNYIHQQFTNFQYLTTTNNESIYTGFPSKIDIPSFVDYMLIAELASNVDTYTYSTFFHKDRNGKLRAGPVWDFNLTFGNDLFLWGFDRSHPDVWQFDNGDNMGPYFWKDLFDNNTYRCYLSKRWHELNQTGEIFSYNMLAANIDSLEMLLTESSQREQQRWGTVGNFSNNLDDIKIWLQYRISWLNLHLGSFSGCENVAVPPLVITKIHYHPANAAGFEDDDLEFIEITNNGDAEVQLTGIYFRELGFTYGFPNNSTLAAHQSIYLASNAEVFEAYHGIEAFGAYSKHLSNKSDHMVLVDAWGNIIDEVRYTDSSPWPEEADGDGFYLQLIDINSDNSLAENWEASSEWVGIETSPYKTDLHLFPNPTNENITVITSDLGNLQYEIYDLTGRLIVPNSMIIGGKGQIDLEHLESNTYFIRFFFTNSSIRMKKIVKL